MSALLGSAEEDGLDRWDDDAANVGDQVGDFTIERGASNPTEKVESRLGRGLRTARPPPTLPR